MKKGKYIFRLVGIVAIVLLMAVFAFNSNTSSYTDDDKLKNDWPQWRGPNRDGISRETGLLKSWPEGGPKVLWRVPSGEGFSGISIANGRGYTMEAQGGDEFAVCFDAATGKEIWRFKADAK
ncbi:MAG: PQQ-binding-like beta-propeller repeat protein, partial [bacterium]